MAPASRTEARSMAQAIRRLHVAGRAFADIAVLAHSIRMLPREFEDELRRQGIPYITSGGSGFFDRQEIKDVLALLRLTDNPMDDGAFVRIMQGPIVRLPDSGMYRLAAPGPHKTMALCLRPQQPRFGDQDLAGKKPPPIRRTTAWSPGGCAGDGRARAQRVRRPARAKRPALRHRHS